jgi:hypothetical protein
MLGAQSIRCDVLMQPDSYKSSSHCHPFPGADAMTKERTFTIGQLVAVQKMLRETLQLPPEEFPLPAFIGMISDEIEQLRSRGMSDEEIAGVISQTTGVSVRSDAIRIYYAPPIARRQ